jgi:hypothetical protein
MIPASFFHTISIHVNTKLFAAFFQYNLPRHVFLFPVCR